MCSSLFTSIIPEHYIKPLSWILSTTAIGMVFYTYNADTALSCKQVYSDIISSQSKGEEILHISFLQLSNNLNLLP